MRIAFTKCHGSGNDFPLVDAREVDLPDDAWAQVARALADRRGPVGGDGLLLLTTGDKIHSFGFRMWNPDGSEAETCLNGLRCVARAGFAALGLERACVRLATSSVEAARDTDLAPGVVTIRETAGPADLAASGWLLGIADEQHVERPIDMLGSGRKFTAATIPNPHLIAFVDQIDEAELVEVGERCEAAPDWLPARANVSFVERCDSLTLFVRTFERGAGLTESCGSAMAASAYVACLTGRTEFGADLTVRNAGGLVRARAESDGMVSLSGNATFEWEGSAEIDLARGTAGSLEITHHYNEEIAAWAAVVDALAAR